MRRARSARALTHRAVRRARRGLLLRRGLLRPAAHRWWFRPETVRSVAVGALYGLRFEVSPELATARMHVFRSAYEREVAAWLRGVAGPGTTVFVVGAHVGIHAIYAARLAAPSGQVHAFEAWPENHRRLMRNIAANRDRIVLTTAVATAVGASTGQALMKRGQSDGTHRQSRDGEVPVPITTIDDYVASGPAPDVMLIDVEGSELDVLSGSERSLEALSPSLLLEHHGCAEALRSWLTTRDYETAPLGQLHIAAEPATRLERRSMLHPTRAG